MWCFSLHSLYYYILPSPPFRAVHHLAALRIGFLCRAWGGFLCAWVQRNGSLLSVRIDFHGHVGSRWRQPCLGNLVTRVKQLSRCSWSPCALREKGITHSLGLLQYLGVLTVYGYNPIVRWLLRISRQRWWGWESIHSVSFECGNVAFSV